MNRSLAQWAIRNKVSFQGLHELNLIFGIEASVPHAVPSVSNDPRSEAWVQSVVRLEASRKGLKLWRNNVGVLENQHGTPVRYGLGNDSKKGNETIKSGDLIGWRPLIVTPDMMGQKIAQFVSRECKRPDWTYTATDHELAQRRWAEAVIADGGDAKFCNGEDSL